MILRSDNNNVTVERYRAFLSANPSWPSQSFLRRRLEALCQEHGIKVRNVLLWKTHSSVGNAAVMGVTPGLRYLLVTDLVLEAMSEEQVVAVFAHEIGHVIKQHHLKILQQSRLVDLGGKARGSLDKQGGGPCMQPQTILDL